MSSIKKIITILVILLIAGGSYKWLVQRGSGAASASDIRTHTAAKRDLIVTVVENGSIESIGSHLVRSRVEGNNTILSIVEEGTIITQEDVDNEKILVELDSSSLRERLSQQEITYNNAEASLIEAEEALDIQKNQNDSDIAQAQLSVEFALMDLQRYFGEQLALQVVEDPIYETDVSLLANLIHDEDIAGGALQKIREMRSNIDLRREDLERGLEELNWTRRLVEREYVAASDLRADEIRVARHRVELERAETNLNLFEKYEFTKEARKLISDYREAHSGLERVQARARSRLAQAESRLRSQQANYRLQKERLENLQNQIEACVIRAEVPGMIVYAAETNPWRGTRTSIEMGANVRERQAIFTIPDPARMAAKIKVHESSIDMVRNGQIANIRIDAMPDQRFAGRVVRIAPLPDPTGALGNPDMKVYSTDVAIDGVFEDLRPGMSARVEVVIRELEDVLAVPLQCVVTRGGRRIAYVLRGGRAVPVEVDTGYYNDSHVQILSGIEPGEQVLLTPPRLYDADVRGERAEPETEQPVEEMEEIPLEQITTEQPAPEAEQGQPQRQSRRRPDGV